MPDLFHPDLPGVAVGDAVARRRAGWREWDDLSKDERAAHEQAVEASQRQQRRDEKAAADRLAAVQAANDALYAPTPEEAAPETPTPAKKQPAKKTGSRTRKHTDTPGAGDTPKGTN